MASPSPPFPLPKPLVEPFDAVYDGVTKRIRARIDDPSTPMPAIGRRWLARLVVTFQDERRRWDERPELQEYRARWRCLQSRALRLAAGAYLHVSYDLPRAMADDWPNSGPWAGLTEAEGEAIYEGLREVFVESFDTSSRRFSIVGMSFVIGRMPRGVRGWIVNWVLLLREAAWRHGRTLATQPAMRASREAAMAKAMTASLNEISRFWPYDVSLLRPPIVHSPVASSLSALLLLFAQYGWAATLLALSLYGISNSWRRRRRTELWLIGAFALILSEYMQIAMENPEEFDAALRARRPEILMRLGLRFMN